MLIRYQSLKPFSCSVDKCTSTIQYHVAMLGGSTSAQARSCFTALQSKELTLHLDAEPGLCQQAKGSVVRWNLHQNLPDSGAAPQASLTQLKYVGSAV